MPNYCEVLSYDYNPDYCTTLFEIQGERVSELSRALGISNQVIRSNSMGGHSFGVISCLLTLHTFLTGSLSLFALIRF